MEVMSLCTQKIRGQFTSKNIFTAKNCQKIFCVSLIIRTRIPWQQAKVFSFVQRDRDFKHSIYTNINYTGWCMSWTGVLQGWLKLYELAYYGGMKSLLP